MHLCPTFGIYNVANTKSCSKYYLCFNGQALSQNCSRGLDFDAESGLCSPPHLTKCHLEYCPQDNNNLITMVPNPNECGR